MLSTLSKWNLFSRRSGRVLTALFFLFHLISLGRNSFWTDELYTYGSVNYPLGELYNERLTHGHVPGYFIIVKAWAAIVGSSEWSLRFPSVVFGACAFLSFHALCARFVRNRRAAAAAIAVFFFSPFVTYTCHEARMYSALIFVCVLASHLLLRVIQERKASLVLAYSLSVLAGLNVHILFFQVLVIHLVFAAVYHRRALLRVVPAIALPLLVLWPMFRALGSEQDTYQAKVKMKLPPVDKAIRKLSYMTLVDNDELGGIPKFAQKALTASSVTFFIVFFGAGIAGYVREKRRQPAPSRLASSSDESDDRFVIRFACYWLAIPVAIMLLTAVVTYDKSGTLRYYSPVFAPLAVLIGYGFAAVSMAIKPWGAAFCGLYALLLVVSSIGQLIAKETGIREGAAYIRERFKTGDGVIYCSSGALGYAFPFYGVPYMPRIGVDHEITSETIILNTAARFAADKNNLWILIYERRNALLDPVLEGHPELYRLLSKETYGNVTVAGFTPLRPAIESSPAAKPLPAFGFDERIRSKNYARPAPQ